MNLTSVILALALKAKEAAILMLADSVEASSRTLADPTPARIRIILII